jgi:uncharacterized protein YneF (UPF0154 family)
MRRKKLVLVVLMVCGLLFVSGSYFLNKYYHKDIKSNPQMYAYQTYWGPPNPVLLIEDLDFKDSLILYYKKVEKGENPYFNFPLKTLPITYPVYVLGYTEDNLLAEVVSYYDRGKRTGGSYLRGYVYSKTLHKDPPIKNN